MKKESEEILNQVKEYASLFFTIDEIAILLDLDVVEFRRQVRGKKSALAKAYLKGKLESMADIRKLTVEFAKKGSPQAEGFVKEYLDRMSGSE
ncbi:hypothetical protein [Draconibacterium orientale]|uniref:hypothetical protein n=1 Tax=Draconibacterium orientale TaxID=1168034 RepID=UPI0029BFBDBA|nr:hypothetical protein [Draconibacterium orientale]